MFEVSVPALMELQIPELLRLMFVSVSSLRDDQSLDLSYVTDATSMLHPGERGRRRNLSLKEKKIDRRPQRQWLSPLWASGYCTMQTIG